MLILAFSVAFGSVNLNTASASELQSLKGIGAKSAQNIISYRKKHKFKRIDEIKNVKGIGEKKFESIKSELTI